MFDSERYPIETPSLARVFNFVPAAATAGFTGSIRVTDEDRALGYLEIKLVNRRTSSPHFDWFTQYIDLSQEGRLKIPGPEQLLRTQGNKSPERYAIHGFTTYKRIEAILYQHSGKKIGDFRHVLDWGCGCGRLTQQLAMRLPHAKVDGVDIDADNVNWCVENIPQSNMSVVPLNPPTSLASDCYDLIVGISVMTHQDLTMQQAWLHELHRAAAPSSYVLLTTHGEAALARVNDASIIQSALELGADASRSDGALDRVILDQAYYKTSYMLRSFARGLFGRYFEVIAILPAANATLQDFVVLRKPSI